MASAGAPLHQLFVGQLHVDHAVSEDMPTADHDAGGQLIQNEFLCGSCFESGAAGDEFWTGIGHERQVDGMGQLALWV